jgi:hypothetical protein
MLILEPRFGLSRDSGTLVHWGIDLFRKIISLGIVTQLFYVSMEIDVDLLVSSSRGGFKKAVCRLVF